MVVLQSEKVFELMKPNSQWVDEVKGVIQFRIYEKEGDTPQIWTVDLKNKEGSITKGENALPDAVVSATDEDFMFVINNRWSLYVGFNRRKIKMSGDSAVFLRFGPKFFPKMKPKL